MKGKIGKETVIISYELWPIEDWCGRQQLYQQPTLFACQFHLISNIFTHSAANSHATHSSISFLQFLRVFACPGRFWLLVHIKHDEIRDASQRTHSRVGQSIHRHVSCIRALSLPLMWSLSTSWISVPEYGVRRKIWKPLSSNIICGVCLLWTSRSLRRP